jgi:YidC/Oxa1 family membrane protein insertase
MPPLTSWRNRSRPVKETLMEKRLLLAIVLSFLILIGYQAFFVKREPLPAQTPEQFTEVQPQPETPLPKKEPAQIEEAPQTIEPQDFQAISGEGEEQIVVETSLYRAVWSNQGAVLKSWRLKEHKDAEGEDLEIISNQAEARGIFPFSLRTDDPSFDLSINSSYFKASQYKLDLTSGKSGTILFQFADEKGTRVEKTFTFRDGKYDFDIQIKTWKNGQEIDPSLLWGPSIGNPRPEDQKKRFGGSQGIAIHAGDSVVHIEERKYKPEQSLFTFVNWAGYVDQYFTALFITSPEKTSAMFIQDIVEQKTYFFLSVNHTERAYIGPKQPDILKELGNNTAKVIKYGFFGFIAEILYIAIKEIHNIIPNWGLSIIILTLLTKIIFFPLTYQSTKSMAKMQELQPKMKAIKAKYKKAKQDIAQKRKMNEETMKLYKEHGVNPAAGCLPMLIQLPVFWGIFRLLIVSIEFRHSPFFLWIADLSVRDPYYVTPILMGITQFISQKMTPTTADPTQQRMMLIMPVIMTIFFMNFPSGLVLYWLTNNTLQIGQQYIMNRIRKKKKRESHGKKRKK